MVVLDAVAALLDQFVPLRRFQVALHHFPHQLAEIRLCLPAQLSILNLFFVYIS
jgi:hypothetical protein